MGAGATTSQHDERTSRNAKTQVPFLPLQQLPRSTAIRKAACNRKGSPELLQYLQSEIGDRGIDAIVSTTSCLNVCEKGPILVIYPQEWWYFGADRGEDRPDPRCPRGRPGRARAAHDLAARNAENGPRLRPIPCLARRHDLARRRAAPGVAFSRAENSPSPRPWRRPAFGNWRWARPPWAMTRSTRSAPSRGWGFLANSPVGAGQPSVTSIWRGGAEVDAVHFSLPVSAIQLRYLHKPKSWVLDQLGRLAEAARQHFAFVSVGAQDASRASPSFLVRCARVAEAAGVDRFRLADTVGVWSPLGNARGRVEPPRERAEPAAGIPRAQ